MSDLFKPNLVVIGSYSNRPLIPAFWLNHSGNQEPAFHPLALREIGQAGPIGKEFRVTGLIHLESTRELATQRERAFDLLAEWVRLFERHVMVLPDSLAALPSEVQDQLGKDLAVLASCRENGFLLLGSEAIRSTFLVASLRHWADPKVRIEMTKSPLGDSIGTNQEACKIALEWVTRNP